MKMNGRSLRERGEERERESEREKQRERERETERERERLEREILCQEALYYQMPNTTYYIMGCKGFF